MSYQFTFASGTKELNLKRKEATIVVNAAAERFVKQLSTIILKALETAEYPIIFFKIHLKSDMIFEVYELSGNANACIESRKILTPFNGYLIPKELEYYCQLLFNAKVEELTNGLKLPLDSNTVTVVLSPFPM